MDKIVRNYWIGISIFSVCVLLTYVNTFYRQYKKYISKTVVLKADPKYDYKTYKGTNYWIDLYFYGMDEKLKISGSYYQYLNHPKFLRDVKKDTTVTITYSNGYIEQLSKDGYNYMDPEASLIHGAKNTLFARILFIAALITTAISFLCRKIMDEESFLIITKNFGVIIVVVLVITGLVTSQVIDPKYIKAEWTKYPVEKRR